MRRFGARGAAILAVVTLLLPLRSDAASVKDPAALLASGDAAAGSTLVKVTVGSLLTQIGRDDASSRFGANPRAFASLVAAHAADIKVGSSQREATRAGQRETSTLGGNSFAIDDRLSLALAGATISSSVTNDVVSSGVDLDLGRADLLGGLATITGGSSVSTALTNRLESQVTRTIEIDGLETFSLGDLLGQMGISPLDLACAAVQDAGALAGVSTSGVCTQLTQAETEVDQATATLSTARADVVTAKNATLASVQSTQADIASKTAQITTDTAQIATYQSTLTTLNAQLATQQAQVASLQAATSGLNQSAIQAARDAQQATCTLLLPGAAKDACLATVAGYDAQLALFSQLSAASAQVSSTQTQITSTQNSINTLNATIATTQAAITTANTSLASLNATVDSLTATIDVIDDASAGASTTCDAASGALTAVATNVASLATTMNAARTELDTVCDALTGKVEALLDMPLISLDGVRISINAVARETQPTISVSGEIGRLTVAGLDPIAVDLPVNDATVDDVQRSVASTLQSITRSLGLNLPLPTFKFLVTTTAKGKRADGTWFADGAVTALQIVMPSGSVSLPSVSPLGILANGTTLLPRVASTGVTAASVDAAATTTPAVTLDLAAFDATTTYLPKRTVKSGGGISTTTTRRGRTEGSSLPVTGVGGVASTIGGAGLLGVAAAIRRWMRR